MQLNESPTWYMLDSSKINDYLDCPRMVFYRHILGWKPDITSHHLIFGEAFHKGMEVLLIDGYNEDAIIKGYMEFMKVWRREFAEDQDAAHMPKTPQMALQALTQYCINYKDDFTKYETLMTEISGSAPIDSEREDEWFNRIHFRIDAVLRHKLMDFILVREHKTATANSRQFADQWMLDVQPGTYTHALYCMYPPEQVWGVEINAVFFKKTMIEFMRIPVRKTQALMQVWLDIIKLAVMRYKENLWLLGVESAEAETMLSFPLNPRSCTKYYGCAYHDFCLSWPNPLQRVHELPQGFRIEHWDPSSFIHDATRKLIL